MLGTSRPRNHGREDQRIALALAMKERQVAYKLSLVKSYDGLKRKNLLLAAHRGEITLPFETCAELVNVAPGRWEALHPFDGHVVATGVSEKDVICRTILACWK